MTLTAKFQWALNSAREKKMCMVPFCGTCGASPFLIKVERALGLKEVVPTDILFRESQYRNLLIDHIAMLSLDDAELNFEALKLFLTLASFFNTDDVMVEVENKLNDTPSGSILRRMKRHYEAAIARQSSSDPALAAAKREEKKKIKAEIHRKRIDFYRVNSHNSSSQKQRKMMLKTEKWSQFDIIIHSDWSVHKRKRWSAIARRRPSGWQIEAIAPFSELSHVLFDNKDQSILAGFDFPIGMPEFWYKAANVVDFPSFLNAVKAGKLHQIFSVAEFESEISYERPFYPNKVGKKGEKKKAHLLNKFNLSNDKELFRECEIATANRSNASPLFWTIGAKQVGKAALTGWKEILIPLFHDGAILWPFQKIPFDRSSVGLVLVETYPAEYYSIFEKNLMKKRSKTNREHRIEAGKAIKKWLEERSISFSKIVEEKINCGFGSQSDGEDQFDAFVGLCAMLDVVLGNRAAISSLHSSNLSREGWIFGQA
jgi:hypothetical protein